MIRQIPFLRRKAPAAQLAALFLGGAAATAMAHSDPWGDIHPEVSVVDGNFSIVFNTSVFGQPSDFGTDRAAFRMIYSPEGAVVAPRHSLERKRSVFETGPAGIYGRGILVGKDRLIFGNGDKSKPGYTVEAADGTILPVELPWPEDVTLTLFEDAVATPQGIGITGKEDETDLKFYWFPFGSEAPPTILNLGPTACIYHFPVASNPVFAGGKFWIAYMGSPKENDKELKTLLWSWKPGEKEAKTEILDTPADWNSTLSMAAIGERLCLAYHCVALLSLPGVPDLGEGGPLAKIVTVFRKAE